MDKEIWVDIIGFEEYYQISNYGKVKSKNRVHGNKHGTCLKPERILSQTRSKNGYMTVKFTVNFIRKSFYVHRLIAIYFIENPLSKPEVNHINGDRSDNRISNLEWATTKENSLHCVKFLNPQHSHGDNHFSAKLTKVKVAELKSLYSTGLYTYKQLAKMYGVSDRSVGAAITGLSWRKL